MKGYCIQPPSDIPKVKTDRGHKSVYQSASTLEKVMLKFWTKSNSKKKFEKQLKRITFTLLKNVIYQEIIILDIW